MNTWKKYVGKKKGNNYWYQIPDAYKKTTLAQNKHYIEKNVPEELKAIIVEEGFNKKEEYYYRIHYRENREFKSTKEIPTGSEQINKLILIYQEIKAKDYFEYVKKQNEIYDDYPSVTDWIFSGGRLEEMIIWAWEEDILE